MLFGAGLYGGFAQAGVGLVLLSILTRSTGLDLVRANALKVAIVGLFTAASVAIFVRAGTIRWLEGAVLACGMMGGAAIAVRFAVRRSDRLERVAVVCVVVAIVVAAVRTLLG